MKIRIELDENLTEDEVIIRCRNLNDEILEVQRAMTQASAQKRTFVFYKGDAEYYLSPDEILFFETDGAGISAHTADAVYETRRKLYELEELLPPSFMRISKSAILNVDKVYAVTRNLTASSRIEFQNTHKQVYVSRNYYRALKDKLEEKRR